MACCGDKRARLVQPGAKTNPEAAQPAQAKSAPPRADYETVHIQYTGRTGLTVTGPFSRRRYRFNQPGEVLEVDRRDAPSLAAVPNLKWLN